MMIWKSLHYLADLWNENPECRKIIVQDYYSEMKYMMKHFGAYIESSIDLAITLFVEFFFINHDDGGSSIWVLSNFQTQK